MTPTLVAPWLLAAGPRGLLAVGPKQVVEIGLPGPRAALVELVAVLATGAPVGTRAEQLELEDKEIEELRAALENAGALDEGGDGFVHEDLRRPHDPSPLKDVLAATLDGAPPTSCFTAEELLLIPDGCPERIARRALHAFVGGARPEARAVSYGQVATHGDGLQGDRPMVDVVAASQDLDPSSLHVVVLDEGTVVSITVDELQQLGAERAHRLGVIQQVLNSGAIDLDEPIYIVRARHATANLRFGSDAWSYGVAPEPATAELIARAEAAERHSLGRTQGVTLRRAHPAELEGVVDPDALAAPNRRQRAALAAPTTDERLWVAAETSDGDRRWVPADAALFPFTDPIRHEPWLVASSSGAAAHLTAEEAAERGMRELIERDAMMWRWVQRVPPAHIVEGSLPDRALRRLAALRQAGWQVDLLDMTLDLLPVAMCCMRRRGQLGLGLGCARSGSAAAQRALDECVMIALSSDGGPEPIGDPTAVRTPTDHLALHHDPVHASSHEFLFESEDEVDPRDVAVPEEPLTEVVRHVGETVLIEHVVPQVRPFRVVRALVPGLVPISFGYDREPLGLPRLSAPITTRDGRAFGDHLDLTTAGPILPHPFP
jgi:thiazole/oxazole-forming peptide maturase SagD family component